MGYALAPSLVAARAEVNAGWPRRDKTSDGWIGDTAHQQTGSDHNVGARDLVHALDVDEDLDGRNVEDGSELLPWFEHLRASRDPRIKYVIYEGRMFSSYPSGGVPAWEWRPYHGKNGHRHHGHLSILSTVTAEQDTRSWFPTLPALEEDDPMASITDWTVAEWEAFYKGVRVGVSREFKDPTSDGRKALEAAAAAAVDRAIDGDIKRLAAFLATGRRSGLFDPKVKGNEWMADAPTMATLTSLADRLDAIEARLGGAPAPG